MGWNLEKRQPSLRHQQMEYEGQSAQQYPYYQQSYNLEGFHNRFPHPGEFI